VSQASYGKCQLAHIGLPPTDRLTLDLDPLYHRLDTHNWTTKDVYLLRTAAEMERHSRILEWHNPHPVTVAVDRISG
jgi:hypothetical protein